METSVNAAPIGGPETETSRWRWLAWLGLGADVSDAAAAVRFISAFALAGIAGMAITGDEVGATTFVVPAVATVSPSIGAPGVAPDVDLADRKLECFRRYPWQPELRREICAGLDELVGEPEALRDGEGNGKDNR